jgi:hypothetical protein
MWLLYVMLFIHIPCSVEENNSQLIKHLLNLLRNPSVTTLFMR